MPDSSLTTTCLTSDNGRDLLLSFGAPTYQHRFCYETLYEAKPYRHATLYYYDNGIYKIISQGEEHYGVYVLSGDFTDLHYTIRYISLPSVDWGSKTAYHHLQFRADTSWKEGTFIQRPIIDSGLAVGEQTGHFITEKNCLQNPIDAVWLK